MAAPHALASAGQPVLADDIPVSIMPAAGQRVVGLLARYLVHGGAVTERSLPQAATDPLQACATALSAWLHQHIGATACLPPVFSLQSVETCKVDEIEETQAVQEPSDVEGVRELAFALARTPVSREFMARREGLFMGFGAVLCWAEDDIAVRVPDDYAQYAWQGDSFGEIGEVVLPANQPSALRRWMRTMTPHLRAIGLIDRLLHFLSA